MAKVIGGVMADIKLRIEVNPDAETEILGALRVDSATKVANTSIKLNNLTFNEIPDTLENKNEGLSFAYGYLVFNNESRLVNVGDNKGVLLSEQNGNELIFGSTDSSGNYEVTLTFTQCSSLDKIVIYGNEDAGQYPKIAYLDGSSNAVTSDDNRFEIAFGQAAETHTIRITKWARPNFNAIISAITVMPNYYDVDITNGLKNVESLSQSTGQPKDVYYGVTPSSGSAEIYDANGDIYDLINNGVIPVSNLGIQILNDNKLIQRHTSNDSDYKSDKMFTIDLDNELSKWSDKNFNGRKLTDAANLYIILKDVLTSVGYSVAEVDDMLSEKMLYKLNSNYVYNTVKSYLLLINIPHPYLEKSKLRDAIDKICLLAQLHVWQKDDGRIVFTSARPIEKKDRVIAITPHSIDGDPKRDLIVKNKVETLSLPEQQVSYEYEEIDTHELQTFQCDNHTNNFNDYTYVIDSFAYNPNITVFGKGIGAANNSSSTRGWFYTILKYDIDYDMSTVTTKEELELFVKFSLSDWFPNNNVERMSTIDYDVDNVTIYSASTTDAQIISQWANLNSSNKPTSIKVGCPNWRVVIRKNNNNTLSVFMVWLTHIIYDNGIAGVYDMLNCSVYIKEISTMSDENTGNSYDLELTSNELLQEGSTFNGSNLRNFISQNILTDYANGLSTASVEVACIDHYDINGKLVIRWSDNEMLQVGDIVVIKNKDGSVKWKYKTGEPIYWRITGRNLKKEGIPKLTLELQEVFLKNI